jgi:SAP domain
MSSETTEYGSAAGEVRVGRGSKAGPGATTESIIEEEQTADVNPHKAVIEEAETTVELEGEEQTVPTTQRQYEEGEQKVDVYQAEEPVTVPTSTATFQEGEPRPEPDEAGRVSATTEYGSATGEEATTTEAAGETPSYDDMTNAQLQEELNRRGLSTQGNKAELTARLKKDDAES